MTDHDKNNLATLLDVVAAAIITDSLTPAIIEYLHVVTKALEKDNQGKT